MAQKVEMSLPPDQALDNEAHIQVGEVVNEYNSSLPLTQDIIPDPGASRVLSLALRATTSIVPSSSWSILYIVHGHEC